MHKYHASPVTIDGEYFASTGEARRYHELKLLQRVGLVRELVRQPSFVLHTVNAAGEKLAVGVMRADFQYRNEHDQIIIEDFKGLDLGLSQWKRRHFEAEYSMSVLVTSRKT